jgi:uncharacterized protein (TIGR02145 family)
MMKKYSRREIGNLFVCFLVLVVLVACSGKNSLPALSEQSLPLMSSDSNKAKESETMTDHRDGQVYKTVKIGSQIWMAENLNYETESSYCYDDRMSNCLKYGRLYTWTPALSACPAGWHLPDSAEWKTLIDTLGGATASALPLKSHTGWFYDWSHFGNGTDSSHFSGFPAGMRNGEDDSVFLAMGKSAYFWSSTDILPSYANGVRLRDSVSFDGSHKKNAYSIRCVKDFVRREGNDERRETKDERRENNVVIPDLIGNLLDPRDGQSYRTVTIGNQTWMAQNLNYETKNSSCFNDQVVNCAKIGSLYTWDDAMNVCPAGYHLPDLSEWRTLFATVGGQTKAGKSLKSQTGWFAGGNGTDSYGFAALPAGDKDFMGTYGISEKNAYFWSSTEVDSNNVYYVNLRSGKDNAYMLDDFKHGRQISVRCVQDRRENNAVIPDLIGNLLDPRDGSRMNDSIVSLSSWSNAIGSITDPRDGQSYKTVKIGSQTWMAENLNFETAASYCYKNLDSNCVKYGRLYTWASAMEVCPRGWRLPNKEDWEALLKNVGGDKSAGKVLKSQTAWTEDGNGTDSYGFSALPAGERTYFDVCAVKGGYTADHMFKAKVNYDSLGVDANFWSSTKDGDDNVYAMKLHCNMDDASLNSVCGEFYSLSVRCVKDE